MQAPPAAPRSNTARPLPRPARRRPRPAHTSTAREGRKDGRARFVFGRGGGAAARQPSKARCVQQGGSRAQSLQHDNGMQGTLKIQRLRCRCSHRLPSAPARRAVLCSALHRANCAPTAACQRGGWAAARVHGCSPSSAQSTAQTQPCSGRTRRARGEGHQRHAARAAGGRRVTWANGWGMRGTSPEPESARQCAAARCSQLSCSSASLVSLPAGARAR